MSFSHLMIWWKLKLHVTHFYTQSFLKGLLIISVVMWSELWWQLWSCLCVPHWERFKIGCCNTPSSKDRLWLLHWPVSTNQPIQMHHTRFFFPHCLRKENVTKNIQNEMSLTQKNDLVELWQQRRFVWFVLQLLLWLSKGRCSTETAQAYPLLQLVITYVKLEA